MRDVRVVALEDAHGHIRLAVVAGGRFHRLGVRDGSVAGKDGVELPARSLQADGHRDYVEELQAQVGVVLQRVGVESRADGDGLVRVYPFGGRLSEDPGEPLLHRRHSRLAADEQELIDFLRVEAGVIHHPGEDLHRPLHQILGERLE